MDERENRNYIKFYFNEEDTFVAEIHKQGKVRLIKSPNNVEKLMDICEKYGYRIAEETLLNHRVFTISREYENYVERRRLIRRLNIVGNILTNMKLKRKDKGLGRRMIAYTLAGIMITSSIGTRASNDRKFVDETIPYQQEQVIDEPFEQEIFIEDPIFYEPAETSDESMWEELEEATSQIEEVQEDVQEELQEMLQEEQFHFSYEDRTSKENVTNARRYEGLFEKYANRYGLDKNLLIAVAAQESCGDHYGNIGNGSAEGIMQIEKSVHIGSTVTAYNFETGEIDSITVTEENLKDLETNIQIGAMILRNCMENNDYNIPLSLQTYNFGAGNMSKVLSICSEREHTSKEEIRNNPTNNSWLPYRENISAGDSEYIEHVFSFLENNTELTVKKRNGESVTISITNDYQKENTNGL